ncbi:uncharacterized protein MELLADRAFT_65585 [Melampsora larici-populina 98AG31]|uniref:Pal1-domain-containing protein n=1 Tax=Melampsora larici-populina (strain 98AG31 / pathotype 3-4-7) TaxID=747676 RepID=F4RVZ3_MELLP|nr:uncharacterized protein MELLADRAFT_65585 [Melampsora larici-populina 98AG31]EGG03499.1 hypothetical protein MELLADRAFT_65585 [Melampsora larici-populina 98AG31]
MSTTATTATPASLVHHDGPFDAASSHRNRHVGSKNPSRQAPMAAFDPSALVFPPNPPKNTQEPSPHTYPPTRSCDSAMSVSMGYPAGTIAADPKAARLAEAFGIQGREAWEDFASTRGNEEFVKISHADLSPKGGSDRKPRGRSERDAKAASVWDMEATMKSGKPVPSSIPPVPSLPNFPRSLSKSDSTNLETSPNVGNSGAGNSMKRSKSLMQRIKKGVRSPPLPNRAEYYSPEMMTAEEGEIEGSNRMSRKTSILGKFGIGRKNTQPNTRQLLSPPRSPPTVNEM